MDTGRRVIQKIFSNPQKYSDNDGHSGEEEGNRLMRHLAALPCLPLVYRWRLTQPLWPSVLYIRSQVSWECSIETL